MARRQKGLFINLLDGSARLGWVAGFAFAAVVHLVMRWVASQKPDALTDTADMANHVIWTAAASVAGALQWLLPAIILIGVAAGSLRRVKQRRLVDYIRQSPDDLLENLTWWEFEELLAGFFRSRGYSVTSNADKGPDGGVDMELRKGDELHLVQCKHWRARKVPVTTVRELFGLMAARGAAGGFVVCSGEFTSDSKAFAAGRNIELIDRQTLSLLLVGRKPALNVRNDEPHRVKNEPACPNCNSSMVRRVSKRGANAGAEFWGCTRYPKCRGTRPIG